MNEGLMIKEVGCWRNRRQLLHRVNLNLAPGRIVGLLGANGAGKTTLMRLIAGSAPHFTGSIAINGATDPEARKALVSFTAQVAGLDGGQKVAALADLLALGYPDFERGTFDQLANVMGLDLTDRLNRLSKGNQRKFTIAATLARRTQLYLLDEPFDGIDVMTRKVIIESIIKWLPEQATLVVSDHHVGDIASLLDQVVILKDQTVAVQVASETIRAAGHSIEDYYQGVYAEGTGEYHD